MKKLCLPFILLSASISSLFAQGSLTPPGAPAPTMKTLDELDAKLEKRVAISSLPTTISSPGAYYLTNNLTGVAGLDGITISTDNVVLDLNGFSLIGVAGSVNGIFFSGTRQSITVRNGVIRQWDNDGILALNSRGVQYLNLHVAQNGRGGLSADFASVIKNCSAVTNGQWGFAANTGSSISDCTARNNGGTGFTISNDGSVVSGCASSENGGSGFFGSGSDLFVHCAAARNKVHGFSGGGNTFRECQSSANSTNGFSGSFGVVIEECLTANNVVDGISVTASSLIRKNHCSNNGNGGDGAGIHTTGGLNRIEDNTVFSNDRGIQIESIRNVVFGNTAGGNTLNYVIAATNQVGVIVSPPNSMVISGGTGGIGMGTTDPWANFSF